MDRSQVEKKQPAGPLETLPAQTPDQLFIARLQRQLQEREREESAFRHVVEGTSAVVGEEFFRGFVRSYARAFGVRHVAIGRFLDPECRRVRTLAAWSGNEFLADYEYGTSGTPCEDAVRRGFGCYERSVQSFFPSVPLLEQLEAETYIGSVIRDGGGNSIGIVIAINDHPMPQFQRAITTLQIFASRIGAELERQQTDQASFESEHRLRRVIEEMPVMMAAYDEQGRLAVWNKECERVTGYRADELVGDPRFLERLCPDAEERSKRLHGRRPPIGNYREWEWRLTAKDGSIKTIAWSSVSAEHPIGGWSSWEVAVDMTAVHEAEREHQDLLERVREAQRLESLGLLAGGIAHDFNNLLVGVLGNTELLLDDLEEGRPERDLLLEVRRAAQRAAGLTSQMLAYSGRLPFDFQSVDVTELAREASATLAASVPENVTLHVALDSEVPPIRGDVEQLRQVLANMVTNGAEAIGKTRGVISLSITSRHYEAGGLADIQTGEPLPRGHYVEVEVADTGCGMDPEHVGRIFDPFRILVVDDEDLILNLARKSLEHGGFEVITASDGFEALEIFREHHDSIGAILLDMSMPQMDGVETHAELIKIRADIPVILSSGFSIQEAGQRFADQDLADFIQKPYRPRDLIEKIRSVTGTTG